ncbi:hypothetical protein KQI58_12295 [Enterococcus raffinosus]|uniref:SdrD B-like domain-containing protein n=1 Tax=Enterococcus raffinosus TaxID=71452 RepID=UPI001C1134AB|nr:SdrD B-like domain-containing protein [Enterococcus raffinosus]MBU5361853.1 hypothetical protein [Enterococcus raffinosus]
MRQKKKLHRQFLNGLSLWLILTLFLANIPFSTIYAETLEETSSTEEIQESTHQLETVESSGVLAEGSAPETSEATELSEIESDIPEKTGSIAGTVWLDENEDGKQDRNERKLPAVKLHLVAADDRKQVISEVSTDRAGNYEFTELKSGNYYVAIGTQILDGIEYLAPIASQQTGAENKFDSDNEERLSYTEEIKIGENEVVADVDAGMRVQAQNDPEPAAGAKYKIFIGTDTTGQPEEMTSTLKEAVDYCNSSAETSFTILLTEDDLAQRAEAEIASGKTIVLTSTSKNKIIQNIEYNDENNFIAKRHLRVKEKASLTLTHIVLEGTGLSYDNDPYWATNGGVLLNGGTLTIGEAAVITKAFGNNGGAIEARDKSSVYLHSTGSVYHNQASDTGGGIYAIDNSIVELAGTSSVSDNIGQWRVGGIYLNNSSLTVNDEAIISGNIAEHNEAGGIKAENKSDVSISGGSIQHNTVKKCSDHGNWNSGSSGGGIYIDGGKLELNNATVSQNTATEAGGGIYAKNTDVKLSNGEVTGNEAKQGNGGGIYSENNAVEIQDSQIGGIDELGSNEENNKANRANKGGGIYKEGGTLVLNKGTIVNNLATDSGGGIYAKNTNITDTSSEVYLNSSNKGAGIYSEQGGLQLEKSTFKNNTAKDRIIEKVDENDNPYQETVIGEGGGLYSTGTLLTLTNAVIADNSSTNGGGIFVKGNTLKLEDTTLTNNTATIDGGGIRATGEVNLEIMGETSRINTNKATHGAGISANENSKISMTDGMINGNIATGRGGGVNLDGTDTRFTMTSGVVSNNVGFQCGGILADKAIIDISNATFTANQAKGNKAGEGYGGGIFVESGGKATIADSTFTENIAYDGGGVYVSKNSQPLTITKTLFKDNKVRHFGGGLLVNGTQTELTDVQFISNLADRYGGGIKVGEGATLKMAGTINADGAASTSMFQGNKARYGGGLSVNSGKEVGDEGSKVTLINTFVIDNKAKYIADGEEVLVEGEVASEEERNNKGGDGAGINIDLSNTELTMTNGKIGHNQADSSGGGLFATASAKFNLSDVPLTFNTAELQGGGLFLKYDVEGTLSSCLVENNTTGINGGGVRLESSSNLIITNSSLSKNTALYGGGVSANSGSTIEMNGIDSKISENSTTHFGGGVNIDNAGTKFIMNDGSIDHNPARNGGGVFASDHSEFIMNDGVVTNNQASNNGGGIYIQTTATVMVNKGNIVRNDAARSGGGIFTENYFYGNPVDASIHYVNITIDPTDGKVAENTSFVTEDPPEDIVNGSLKFKREDLNNDQINYFPHSLKIIYHPNGGQGMVQEDQRSMKDGFITVGVWSVKQSAFIPAADKPDHVLLYWSEKEDGTGKRYTADGTDTITTNYDRNLYAIWGPPTTLSGTVFLDRDHNGEYDENEVLENREVTLYKKADDSESYTEIDKTHTNQEGKYYFATSDNGTYKISVKVLDGEYGKHGFVSKREGLKSSHVNQDGFSDYLTINIEEEMNPVINAGYIDSVVVTGVKLNPINWFFYLLIVLLTCFTIKRVCEFRKKSR